MSKHERKEVAKSLKEQIKVTTDPEQLIKLTREYNRITNPRYGGKRAVKEVKPPKQTSSPIVPKWADRLSHVPEKQRILTTLICEVEERQRQRGQKFTEAERTNLLEELFASFTEEERNSGSQEVA